MSAVDVAREGLCRMISKGELSPGDPLPSEQELCDRFGVSRSSVREAQKMLVVAGVLTAKPGAGASVSAMSARDIMAGLEMVVPLLPLDRYLELFELREVLEGHIAAKAAAKRSDEQADRLLALALQLADTEPSLEAQQVDSEFHELIGECAGDELIGAILSVMRQRGRHYRILEAKDVGPALKALSDDEHVELAQAIKDRDPSVARLLAMSHVRTTRKWLEGARPAPQVDEVGSD
ncbi:FadR/GntR family transcriptional regulator [Tessaracoccus sp. Y36]